MELITTFDMEQNTPAWEIARCGMATASMFQTLLPLKRTGKESIQRKRYINRAGAELLTQKPHQGYRNSYMDRGHLWEPDARLAYQLAHPEAELELVGFVRRNDVICGCSPDALIGDRGGLEVKTMEQDLMFEFLQAPDVPPEHMAQIQGLLWITERDWWDLIIYSEGFDPWITRVQREEPMIQQLRDEVIRFNKELEAAVLQLTGKTCLSFRELQAKRLEEALTEANRQLGDVISDVMPMGTPLKEQLEAERETKLKEMAAKIPDEELEPASRNVNVEGRELEEEA